MKPALTSSRSRIISKTVALCVFGAAAYAALLHWGRPDSVRNLDLTRELGSDGRNLSSLNSALERIVAQHPSRKTASLSQETEPGDDLPVIREKLKALSRDERASALRGDLIEELVARPFADAETGEDLRRLIEDELEVELESAPDASYVIRLQRAFLVTEPSLETAIDFTERAARAPTDRQTRETLCRQFRFHFPSHVPRLAAVLAEEGFCP